MPHYQGFAGFMTLLIYDNGKAKHKDLKELSNTYFNMLEGDSALSYTKAYEVGEEDCVRVDFEGCYGVVCTPVQVFSCVEGYIQAKNLLGKHVYGVPTHIWGQAQPSRKVLNVTEVGRRTVYSFKPIRTGLGYVEGCEVQC